MELNLTKSHADIINFLRKHRNHCVKIVRSSGGSRVVFSVTKGGVNGGVEWKYWYTSSKNLFYPLIKMKIIARSKEYRIEGRTWGSVKGSHVLTEFGKSLNLPDRDLLPGDGWKYSEGA